MAGMLHLIYEFETSDAAQQSEGPSNTNSSRTRTSSLDPKLLEVTITYNDLGRHRFCPYLAQIDAYQLVLPKFGPLSGEIS